jgi:hypothetical protein
LLLLAVNPESEAALVDRAKLPPDVAAHAVYLSLSDCPPTRRDELENALRFIIPSLSSKVYLPDQLPLRIEGTNLLRLDLAGLGWESSYPTVLAKHLVPIYRPDLTHAKAVPLVAPALWFAASVIDPIETGDAQYLLLYGGKPPKTAAEFLSFWGIQDDPNFLFGTIEGASGVAVQRTRLIENRPGSKRNVAWLTRDSASVSGANDPLESLPNKVKFDAQELIVQIPKWSYRQSGHLQAYFLANGAGVRQEKAPADIVVDHTAIRGVEIRNTLSCISCHAEGINAPTSDAFRAYIESGARVAFAKKDEQQATDRYLASDVAKEVAACQATYAAGVKMCNGLDVRENLRAILEVVRTYDADVDIHQAARELYCEPRELQLALAYYSRTQTLTGRLALLAQGGKVSRQQWKASYAQAQGIYHLWSQNK